MQNLSFDKIDILMVDSDLNSRNSIKMVLQNNGFKELRLCERLEKAKELIDFQTPDLLISSSQFPDENFCTFVSSIRHHEFGANPFIPIIATTWTPTPELVTEVIESGADDLLTKPISTAQLLDRIQALVKSRKKFVVTSDYIGPVRGKGDKDDAQVPKMEVPNTLKAKATGEKVDVFSIQNAIDDAINQVNIKKLEGHADQIGGLVLQIVPNLEMGGETGDAMDQLLDRLLYLAEDTARRLGGTKYSHVSELCRTLIKVTDSILKADGPPKPKDVKLLLPLSQAIQAGFASTESAAAALEISASIKGG